MTTSNFSCPKCPPVSRDDLPVLMDEINEVLYNYGVTQGLCGEAVGAATILGAIMVRKRMELMGMVPGTPLKELLIELEAMADELIKVEKARAGL